MRRIALILLTALPALPAQSLLAAGEDDVAARTFQKGSQPPYLRCEIKPVHPALNFGLRFQTGYVIRVALDQYRGAGHMWVALSRVTPEGGAARYLILKGRLPAIPASTKGAGTLTGTFVVGEGAYLVETLLADETGRICSSRWNIQAKPVGPERDLDLPDSPLSVRSVWDDAAAATGGEADPPGAPITVLLHAAPQVPSLSELEPEDIGRLAGSLSALMEQLRLPHVRLVIFNLSQHAVLYRNDRFGAGQMEEAIAALNATQLSVVSYQTMRDGRRPLQILDGIVRDQIAKSPAPGATIFLGPFAPELEKIAPGPEVQPGANPHLFYLEYRPPWQPSLFGGGFVEQGTETASGAMLSIHPDFIERYVRLAKGGVMTVRTPADFAEAVGRIRA